MENVAEYLLVLRIKPGAQAPSIEGIGAALEVGTEDAPEHLGFDAIEQIVVKEPREDLTEALRRAEEQCNSYGARAGQFASALRSIAALCSDQWVGKTERQVIAELHDIADKALNTAPALEPRFMVQWDNAARAEFYELRDITDANEEGDPELCAWAREAEVGDSYRNGGGASPLITTWRIA